MKTIDESLFKKIVGQFPAGVTVVTCCDNDENIVGITASSFTSVSLDPALVLFCPNYKSDTYSFLEERKKFAIHLLAEHQEAEAYAFASKGREKLEKIEYTISPNQLPLLKDYLAVLECELYANYEGGDHSIVVGKILDMQINEAYSSAPMVYCSGVMGSFERLYKSMLEQKA